MWAVTSPAVTPLVKPITWAGADAGTNSTAAIMAIAATPPRWRELLPTEWESSADERLGHEIFEVAGGY